MSFFSYRHRAVIGLLILVTYLVVPFLDSVVCSDCKGSIPFSGEVELRHLAAPHIDVVPSVGNETDPVKGTSSGNESKSVCSICVNIAAATYSCYSAPLDSIEAQSTQFTDAIPSEPSFSISKPPQNYPVA